jgi:soluble lytic murein transglycosylase-like protein
MKRFIPFLFALALQAADKPAPAAAINNDSLAQQRQSIEKQLQSLRQGSFFMLPPPLPMAPSYSAECDPLPEDQVNALTDEAAKKESLKPELLRAIIRQESGFRPCAVSAKGAQGLMQLMPATAEQLAVRDVFDPRQNVHAGAKYLKQLLGRYAGDVPKALAAYNAGTGRVDSAGGVPSIPETINYVSSILAALPLR